MSDVSLDLRNQPRVVDFMVDVIDFAPTKDRVPAEVMIATYQAGTTHVPTDKLAEAARSLAYAVWPVRFALQRFFGTEGASEELKVIESAVRPSTMHLIKRVKKSSGVTSMDALMAHPDADAALKEGERHEIEQIRHQFRVDYWKTHAKKLGVLVTDGESELRAIRQRFDQLRELAVELPRGLQDEVFSKIGRYEDRILFRGEIVPLTILDEEVAYYTEQKLSGPIE